MGKFISPALTGTSWNKGKLMPASLLKCLPDTRLLQNLLYSLPPNQKQ